MIFKNVKKEKFLELKTCVRMGKEREIMKDDVEKGKGEGCEGGMRVWGKDKEGKGRENGKGGMKRGRGGWLRKEK